MSGGVGDEKEVDVNIERYLVPNEMKQSNTSPGSHELKNDPNNLFYEKIQPIKPEQLDIEAIIAEYNMSVTSKNIIHPQKIEKKQKPKILTKPTPKQPNPTTTTIIIPKMILTQQSTHLINSFKNLLHQKFTGFTNELTKQRKTSLQRLFTYLCFGFQQILQSFKTDVSSMNILASINREDIFMLLKQRALAIDLEILNCQKSVKRSVPSLKFKGQWKHVLDLVREAGNSKLRQAIIIDEVPASLIVYAREIDLIKYLSPERQNKLKFEAEEILKNSQTGNQWVIHHSESDIEHDSKEKSLLTESETETEHDSETSTFENDSIDKGKSNSQKSKTHKSKKSKRNQEAQLMEQKGMKKIRKTNENICK